MKKKTAKPKTKFNYASFLESFKEHVSTAAKDFREKDAPNDEKHLFILQCLASNCPLPFKSKEQHYYILDCLGMLAAAIVEQSQPDNKEVEFPA